MKSAKPVILKVKQGDIWDERRLKSYLKKGYTIASSTGTDGGWNVGKAALLGAVFLPLALAGKKKPVTTYVLQPPK